MKSTKLLAALAGTALLAACTQEELVKVENAPQTMEEVVGAKLVGTDLSLNVSMGDAQTRYAGGVDGWDSEDKVGLGWIVNKDGAAALQPEGEAPVSGKLYANHMFDNAGDNVWTTKGNIYEGWYFSYYPWSYQAQSGVEKVYTLNPDMLGAGPALHLSQTLYLSARQHISADPKAGDLDTKTGNLSTAFRVQRAVNFIQFTATAKGAFAKGGDLADEQIVSMTIDAGADNKIFANELTIDAQYLPIYTDDWNKPESKTSEAEEVQKTLYAGTTPVLRPTEMVSSITRNVAAADLFTSTNPLEDGKNKNLYFNVIPQKASDDFDETDVTLTVYTTNGYFVINSENTSKTNTEAIKKLVTFYKGETAGDIKDVLALDIELYPEIFKTDFSHICCEECWNNAVKMVDILGREKETFTIAPNDKNGHNGTGLITFADGINMPETCKLTVLRPSNANGLTSTGFEIAGNLEEWPADLNTNHIRVIVNDGVTIENAHTIKAQLIENYGTLDVPTVEQGGAYDSTNTLETAKVSTAINYYGIKNYGTINLEKWAKVVNVDNSGDENGEGRINVAYGSYVNLTGNTEEGIIAHVVDADDVKTPSRIAKLVTDWQMPYENEEGTMVDMVDYVGVNTLVLNNGIDLDLTWKDKDEDVDGDNDPYTPSEDDTITGGTANYGDLSKVDFEINGGSLKSSTSEKAVMNVTMNGGTIDESIKIAGDLTIESGVNTVNATDIEGALNITDGSGTITSAASIASVNIVDGNYTVNAQAINKNTDGVAIDATGENYFNVKTINGDVEINNTSSNATNIDGATINGNVTLNGDILLNNVNIDGNLTVLGGTVKMADSNISETLEVKAGANVEISGKEAFVTAIENYGVLTTAIDVYAETVAVYKGATANVADEKTIWFTKPNAGMYGYIQQGTTYGRILYLNGEIAYTSTAEELKDALTGEDETIFVKLGADIDLPISSLGTITSGSGEYKLGGENTKNITIDLNGKKLNITTTYWSAIGAKNDNATITIKNGSMTSTGNSAGTWNAFDVRLSNCNYVIENVTFDKPVALDNVGKSTKMNTVTINDNGDRYALWITAEGQTVEIDGLTVKTSGRGIKIDEQYVGTPAKVTLKVSNSTFETANKSAIIVKSAAGADIQLNNIDINKVNADKVNAVWVDADAAAYANLVTVSGGTKIVEP